MNTIITSREAILAESRKIVMEHGISAINMRNVAKACGIAVGSLYNYFPSKADLISASIEDVWKDIFHMSEEPPKFLHITDCLSWLFDSIQNGCRKYPGFFTLHSVSFASEDKDLGRRKMEHYFKHMKQSLRLILDHDPLVRKDAFNDVLTPSGFIELLFTMTISLVLQEKETCLPLLEVVQRCIY